MSKSRRVLILLLSLTTLVLIGWNLAEPDAPIREARESSSPTYQSKETETTIYDPTGSLQYKLVADDVKHYADDTTTWFSQPVTTLFNKDATPTWLIRADSAKLTSEKILYLQGRVKLESLLSETQLKTIETESASIDLTSQDIASDGMVYITGVGFISNGMKMRGNLRNKHAELIEKVKTTYEIQQP
jgi:lipopolysaccharide export system protein LptC